MDKGRRIKDETENNIVPNNTILFSLDCWGKYIEGFLRGLQSSDKVNSSSVMDCIGEVLEFMNSFKPQLSALLNHCEEILIENQKLKEKIHEYESTDILMIEENNDE